MLLQFDQNIKEAKNALKIKHLMNKTEITYWNKQIKINEQKKKLFTL